MEQVLGMIGNTPSRVRKMILRSNAIKTRHYAINPETRETTHTSTELAVEAINDLTRQGMNVNAWHAVPLTPIKLCRVKVSWCMV